MLGCTSDMCLTCYLRVHFIIIFYSQTCQDTPRHALGHLLTMNMCSGFLMCLPHTRKKENFEEEELKKTKKSMRREDLGKGKKDGEDRKGIIIKEEKC